MICQNCKMDLQGDFKFCPHCGAAAAQKPFCPGCGKATEAGWSACPFCGYKLPAQAAPAPPTQQVSYEPKHGYHHGSSSDHRYGGHQGNYRRRKGFLGRLFSS